jgi:CubicO group peptidase (beta-lactamase class C family)
MKPVILVAFANNDDDPLLTLYAEEAAIKKQLAPLIEQDLCDLQIVLQADTQKVLDAFQQYKDRVAIFHYAGHAESYELHLESVEGQKEVASGRGFADFLKFQKGLQLVFLNACSTEPQVEDLINANVSAVIATSRQIDESIAAFLSLCFYRSLGAGKGIWKAFKEAAAAVRMRFGDERSKYYKKEVAESDQLPWNLHIRPGSEIVKEWNIPEAAGNPLFGLPDIPEGPLPDSPYRYFQWFREEDAALFYGRGRDVRQLYDKIVDRYGATVIHLYGRSGVGKSSLLAAGLLPRLKAEHDVYYRRADTDMSGLVALASLFKCPPNQAAIIQRWKTLEKESEKAVTIILDQFERAAMTPVAAPSADQSIGDSLYSNESPDPFMQFAQELSSITDGPAGKLILSYRKEYLAEIEDRFISAKVEYQKQFLDELDLQGIHEAISGITLHPATAKKYQLTVEDGLSDRIAYDLQRGDDLLIAPVLQVLLSKMWDEVQQRGSAPYFSMETYRRLSNEGILLDDFLRERLGNIQAKYPDQIQSGLVYDILMYHVDTKGASQSRDYTDLNDRYQHIGDKLSDILVELENQYLLVTVLSGDGAKHSQLAHDVLAPLIRHFYEESDYDGQRARRILNHRLEEWLNKGSEFLLSKIDLNVVFAGQLGMGVLTEDELKFISASRKKNRKKKAIRIAQWSILALALLVIAGLSINTAMQQAEIANQLLAVAQQEIQIAEQKAELAEANLERQQLRVATDSLAVGLEVAQEQNLAISESFSALSGEKEIADLRNQILMLINQSVDGGFSGAIYFEYEGIPIVHDGFGMAQQDSRKFFTESTVFDVGGIAKIFTAISFLQEARSRSVDLNEAIGDHLDDVPADKGEITIRHLLQNSSGLSDFPDGGRDFRKMDRKSATKQILNLELVSDPGQSRTRSNADYILLASLLDQWLSTGFTQYVDGLITNTYQLVQTGLRGSRSWDESNVARGYGVERKSRDLASEWPEATWSILGAGGMLSNISDLVKLVEQLENQSLTNELAAQNFVFTRSNGGAVIRYDTRDDYGQNATIRLYPDHDAKLIMLSNSYDKSANLVIAMANQIEAGFLK